MNIDGRTMCNCGQWMTRETMYRQDCCVDCAVYYGYIEPLETEGDDDTN